MLYCCHMLTPWGTLYHGPSFARRRHRWHCLLDSASMGCFHRTWGPVSFGCLFLSPCLCHCYTPWISLSDSGRKLYIRACGHYLSASDRTMVLIVGQPWLCVYVCGGEGGEWMNPEDGEV